MPFGLSRCVCLSTADRDRAVDFYGNVLGLEVSEEREGSVEFRAEPYRLFIDGDGLHSQAVPGMIPDPLVPNLGAAKKELLKAGCSLIRRQGRGKDCYMQDPFGVIFKLSEEPEAFQE
jgi:catechol 2,3-dioxygenase-like lactoylglutathione lyase family enzyme